MKKKETNKEGEKSDWGRERKTVLRERKRLLKVEKDIYKERERDW